MRKGQDLLHRMTSTQLMGYGGVDATSKVRVSMAVIHPRAPIPHRQILIPMSDYDISHERCVYASAY